MASAYFSKIIFVGDGIFYILILWMYDSEKDICYILQNIVLGLHLARRKSVGKVAEMSNLKFC